MASVPDWLLRSFACSDAATLMYAACAAADTSSTRVVTVRVADLAARRGISRSQALVYLRTLRDHGAIRWQCPTGRLSATGVVTLELAGDRGPADWPVAVHA
jgi:hypothetical protein